MLSESKLEVKTPIFWYYLGSDWNKYALRPSNVPKQTPCCAGVLADTWQMDSPFL